VGILLDGHNRFEICQRLQVPYETTPIDIADRLDAKIWIHRNQLGRRNLSDDQRAMTGAALAELEIQQSKKERAKAGRATGGDATPEQKADRSEADASPKRSSKPKKPKERTRKAASKQAGVSEWKMRKAREVREADPDLAAQVLAGEIDLAAATREIKRRKVVADLEDVARREAKRVEGVFDVVVLDPPWPMEKIERNERPNQVAFDYP